jgi:hypothetical protein
MESSAPTDAGLRADEGLRAGAELRAGAVGKPEAAGAAGSRPGSAAPEMADGVASAPIGAGASEAEDCPAGASSKNELNVKVVGRPGTFERALAMVEVEADDENKMVKAFLGKAFQPDCLQTKPCE